MTVEQGEKSNVPDWKWVWQARLVSLDAAITHMDDKSALKKLRDALSRMDQPAGLAQLESEYQNLLRQVQSR
jgi:chaperone required for assembly of F1-ATPase